MTKVSIAKCDSYNKEDVYKAVKKAVDLIGGIEKFVKKDQKVLLKPNLLSASRVEKRITTDPAVLEAVIRLVKPITKKIYVGDSPAIQSTLLAVDVAGLKKICNKYNVEIADFEPCSDYKFREGKKLKGFQLATIVKEVDVIINLPKFKTHIFMTFAGAVKNLYGCISGLTKAALHFTFPRRTDFGMMLLDIYHFIKPQLNIMDAVIGMEGRGPANGKPKKLGFIAASSDALSLDWAICNLAKIDSGDVPILTLTKDKSEVVGDKVEIKNLEYPKTKTFFDSVPVFFARVIRNVLRSKPIVNTKKCTACENCVKICPAKTIKIINKKAYIIPKECIRCYCCHEICPYDAIDLKKPHLRKIYDRIRKR